MESLCILLFMVIPQNFANENAALILGLDAFNSVQVLSSEGNNAVEYICIDNGRYVKLTTAGGIFVKTVFLVTNCGNSKLECSPHIFNSG